MMLVGETCEQYLRVCENKRQLSEHTIKAYSVDLKQLENCIGKSTAIRKIKKNHLVIFHNKLLERELSQASVKRKLACARAMFRWLEVEEIIEVNPFHKLRIDIKIPRRLPRNVPKSDMRLMLKKARACLGPRDWFDNPFVELGSKRDMNYLTTLLSVELLVCTGIRVCELCRIKLQDVFLSEKKVKILGKGSRERYVYLPSMEVCALLELYVKNRAIVEPANDHLIVNSRGKIASTQFIRKLIKNIAKEAKTRIHVTPHMLRHSAACELLESGLDMRFVQRLLGHSSISTTEIYTHVADNVLQQKIEKADVRSRIMQK